MNINNSTFENTLKTSLLKWLHAIDFRSQSPTFGIADREYWAWKTKDFANGTLQAGIAGFLDCSSLLELEKKQLTHILKANLNGTKSIQRKNGSFEEAYPYESSYAVTGLVLFNLLYVFKKYPELFNDELTTLLKTISKKAFKFLEKVQESHGVIANHLCTSILAKQMYRNLFLNSEDLNDEVLTFLKLQHIDEWWFPEYGKADPGYQTLLNHYLHAYNSIYPSEIINKHLIKSLEFVNYFKFSNGVFSGEIGSRGTSIL